MTSLEPLQFKNRQMKMPTFRIMTNQAVTKVIQMFPPKIFILIRSIIHLAVLRSLTAGWPVVLRGSNGDAQTA